MDGYENLLIALIERTVLDYRLALKGNNEAAIKSIERFLLSRWGQFLTFGNGAEIIERVKREVKEGKQEQKKNKKSRPARVIVAYKTNGEFVGEFNTIDETSVALNVSISRISECCRGVIPKTRGYIFRYKYIEREEK